MPMSNLTPEQKALLDEHVAGIGHNQGPIFVERAEHILENVARHHVLKGEATRIRVMLDMLESHYSGERLLPSETVGFAIVGLGLVCAITASSIVVSPIPTLLLDAPVAACVIAALHGEIDGYVDWRSARDPAYETIKRELSGASTSR
jgi:hypothetical protein